MKKIYVGNLSYQTDEKELETLFGEFGVVKTATVIRDRHSGDSKGFGFVEMDDNTEAEAAISGLNERSHGGRSLKVNEAKPREPRAAGGGGGRDRW
ncbi:MAG: RNA-binding protein [Planctomycetota bacterium]|nr:RNA-binding protein [Planctomycetota bacterium]MCZ6697872.1 RNA-binding protein [Planctomycetota bacterium]